MAEREHAVQPAVPAPTQRHWLRTAVALLVWILALQCVLLTANLWWSGRPYLLDLLTHFSVPVGYVLLVLLLVSVVLLRARRLVVLLLLASVFHWSTVLWKTTSSSPVRSCDALDTGGVGVALTILSYNIDSKRVDSEEWFEDILETHDPDVICFIETPHGMGYRLDPDQTKYPYRVHPRADDYTNIEILSRYPFELPVLAPQTDDNRFSYIRDNSPLFTFENGSQMLLSVFHPASPRTADLWRRSTRSLVRDGQLLRAWLDEHCVPAVAVGDFNTTPFGRMHEAFATTSGYRSHARPFVGGTWPSEFPSWFSLPIDSVWSS
ncbi:MAG: endonuclease/exonuclease/phosphatase family protein, partial [Planctomycetota bacterium]